MKLEKYKQERLGYCSTEIKCGQEKALKTMKYKRQKNMGDNPQEKEKKCKECNRDREVHMQKSRSQEKHGRKGSPVRQL